MGTGERGGRGNGNGEGEERLYMSDISLYCVVTLNLEICWIYNIRFKVTFINSLFLRNVKADPQIHTEFQGACHNQNNLDKIKLKS